MLYRWYALGAVAVVPLLVVATRTPTQPQSGPKFHHRQGGEIEGVFFLDSERGWTAEEGARVRYWVDQTQTWEYAETPNEVRVQLRGIFFRDMGPSDPAIGWAVGDRGVILHSDNGGADWTWLNEGDPILDNKLTPGEASLWAIYMFNAEDGIAVGEDGAIVQTSSNWDTWDYPSCDLPTGWQTGHDPHDNYDIWFMNADHGVIASEYGSVLLTDDGGCTWEPVDVDAEVEFSAGICPYQEHPNVELWDLDFDDPNDPLTDYWIVGGAGTNNGYVFLSTWDDVAEERIWTQTRCYDGEDLDLVCGLSTVYGVAARGTSETEAFFAGYSSSVFGWEEGTANFDPCECTSGEPTECENADRIWKQHSVFDDETSNPPLLGAARVSPTEGCIVGRAGIIRRFFPEEAELEDKFDDQGTGHWERIRDGIFLDEDTGFVALEFRRVKKTTDGGVTWTTVYEPSSIVPNHPENWFAIDFGGTSGERSLAVGEGGDFAYSTDSWETHTTDSIGVANLHAVAFVPDSNAVWVGGANSKVYYSTTPTTAWTPTDVPDPHITVWGLSFAENGEGYAVGQDTVNQDGVAFYAAGVNDWSSVTVQGTLASSLNDVATWGDASSAIAVGNEGKVYTRTNGGRFLQVTSFGSLSAPTVDLFDVEVLNDGDDVIITGDAGYVLFRNDGVWSTPKSQANSLLVRASFQAADHGFILGAQFLVCEYE